MTRTLSSPSGPRPEEAPATWPELFAGWVAATPDAVAVECRAQRLTYAELDDRSARLATVLVERGAGPETLVALAVPRGVDLVVAQVAILRAGAAYLPLDPDQPPSRTELVVDDARPAVLLGTRETAAQLPLPAGTPAVLLDDDAGAIAAAAPASAVELDVRSAAYVIHTSGSTGRPKGVVVTHSGVAQLVATQSHRLGVGPDDRVLGFASTGFDVAFWELCMALLSGGRLVVVPAELRLPGPELAGYAREHAVTVMALPPALLAALPPDVDLPRATLLAGTERVSPELVARWGRDRRMVNAYGPTEATVNSTLGECDPARTGPTVPIGVPDPQTTVHVLGPDLAPADEGELYLGGPGLARGYLNRPGLTAERFVADPFGGPGERLYRTGDLVRRDPDGELEFLGRADDQLKVRGYRIEPGEIESVLRAHPHVADAVAGLHEPAPGDRRLAAWVVPATGGTDAAERVSNWKDVHELLYAATSAEDGDPTGYEGGFAGWNSTYDGTAIPRADMRAWRDATVERIRELGPGRVLELGVGNGLLLAELAAGCPRYVGTDVSAEAVAALGRWVDGRPELQERVELHARAAHELDDLAGPFDTIVINSVAQYFPGPEYLLDVLQRSAGLLAPGGAIFVGDVRHAGLLRTFRAGVVATRSPAADPAELRRALDGAVAWEGELLCHPDFFTGLDGYAGLDGFDGALIRIKRATAHDELSRYRYDVVLRRSGASGAGGAPGPEPVRLSWAGAGSSAHGLAGAIRGALADGRPDALRVTGVPDLRSAGDRAARARIDGEPEPEAGADPEELLRLGESLGYTAAGTWGSEPTVELLFTRPGAGSEPAAAQEAVYRPTGAAELVHRPAPFRDVDVLVGTLREHLRDRLPDWMVPAAVVPVPSIPVLASGKTDRAALPAPDLSAQVRGTRPGTPREELLCTLVSEVLGVPGIGTDDDFFALGGDSVLSIRLVVRAREAGLTITPRQVFTHRTVQELAEVVGTRTVHTGTDCSSSVTEPDDEAHAALEVPGGIAFTGPVSPLQEGFFFHAALDPSDTSYVVQEVLDLPSDVDSDALRAAVQDLLDRHPQLRAGFAQRADGRVVQAVAARVELPWSEHHVDAAGTAGGSADGSIDGGSTDSGSADGSSADGSSTAGGSAAGGSAAAGTDGGAAVLDAERARPFDLARPPLLRAALLHDHGRARLALTFQHAVLDGWSVAVLVGELQQAYAERSRGRTPADDGRTQQAEARLRAWFDHLAALDTGPARAEAREVWDAELAGAEPVRLLDSLPGPALPGTAQSDAALSDTALSGTELPAPVPRPHARRTLTLDAEATGALDRAARAQGVTPSTLLHAAWALTVGALTGNCDVLVGSTVSGRDAAVDGIAEAVGLFVNTVPVRLRWAPGEPLSVPLRRMQEGRTAVLDHPQVRLADLQRDRGELFDSIVVVENFPAAAEGVVGDVEVRDAVHYPLALVVGTGAETTVVLKHDLDRVDVETAALVLELFGATVHALVHEPARATGSLPLRAGAEPAAGPVRPLDTRTLPERITAGLARDPGRTVVVAPDGELAAAELDRRSAALAGALRERGAGPGTVVGVAVPRSCALMVALTGVLRSGAAYLPLDPEHPPERLSFVAADAGVDLVVVAAQGGPAEGASPQDVPLPGLPGVTRIPVEEAAAGPVPAELPHPDPDDAAYLIYTSGSTGRPKGVVVSHRAVGNRLDWMQDAYPLGADDRVLQKTPAGFDVSVWEFFWALAEGATVVLARPGGHRDPEYLAATVRDERITTLHFVPSMLEGFLAAEQVTADAGWARSLRRVFCSGEALPAAAARDWHALTGVPLHNLYGPTEAAVDVTAHAVAASPVADGADGPGSGAGGTVPIGTPVWNTRTHVLDACLRPVPDGVPGELYLAGVQLARGYHARPDLTADRFVADPFGGPGERLYRTGDVVRRTGAAIEYLGRDDGQVKIRGQRIELGEIEAALGALDGVARAAVVIRRDGPAPTLVGYVVPRAGGVEGCGVEGCGVEGCGVEGSALREALAARLPEAMVPAAVVVLDDLPLTPNGKLDRAALPAPGATGSGASRAPATHAERVLCAAFAEVLQRDTVSADDDFLALGGDSITSIAVSSRARRAGLDVGPADVLAGRTPAAVAGRAGEAAAPIPPLPEPDAATWDRVRAVAGSGVAEIWPLSPLQEGLYFHATLDGAEHDVYTVQETVDLDHELDLDRFRDAVATLMAHHPALCAGFTADGLDGPVQFVLSDPAPPVEVVELGVAGADVDTERERATAADRATPLDPAAPPLFRVTVLRGGGRDRVLIHRHLLIWDGWSAWLVLRGLFDTYAGDTPPEPGGSYRDLLAWLAARDPEPGREAWRTALAGLQEPTLAGPPPGTARHEVTETHSELDAATSARLRELARERGVTPSTVLTTAWALALAAGTGRTDVVFGTSVAGRPSAVPDVENVVGLFLNTVPARVVLQPAESGADLLTRVQDERLALLPHETVGLGEIQRLSGHRTLFDTLFVYRPEGGAERIADLGARHGVTALHNVDATHYPLTFIVTPGERFRITLSHTVGDDEAAAWIGRVERAVTALLDGPGDPVAGQDLRSEAERAAVERYRDGDPVDLAGDTIADLLAERAAVAADDLALVSHSTRLSYAELDAAVNRTARLLLARGAGPETVVALGLPRSAETVIALFAVLRTGAAYLPLELDHPAARLVETMRDAGPVALLTTSDVAPTLDGAGVATVVLDAPAVTAERSALDPGPLTDDELGGFARSNPRRLDLPAYVIYTSGSTGRPKGVVTPYRGLTNMQINHRREIFDPVVADVRARRGPHARLRVAHTVSFAFDMSWEELLWLVEGHEVHVADEELRRDAERLVAYCDEHAVDVVNVTPTYAAALLDAGLLAQRPMPLVLLGGEAVSDAVWTALREADGVLGYNLYGPTEYTINTLGAGTEDSATPTVGRPITNTTAHVLDAWLRPVPDGVPGELYIAGDGLARGYLGRYGLTAERFVADPHRPGGRMYRTGDLVRRRIGEGGRGVLDFLGRTDDQVKIRGHRVEPGEVAAVLDAHPAVARAAVVADRSGPGGIARLVGYVVAAAAASAAVHPEPGADLPRVLRDDLRERLPDHLVPAAIVVVEDLPLTVNGKLDTGGLPAPDLAPAGQGRPPATPAEETLCGLFAQVLELPRVGPEDDFFDLGGHSLLATRLLTRARTALGTDLVLRDLFAAPTPELLAARAGVAAPSTDRPELVARPDRGDLLPLSGAQARLWLVSREGASAAYNYPLILRLSGELDTGALGAALDDVVTRHEALRTVIVEPGPRQRILPAARVPFTVAEPATPEELAALVAAELERPFDLAREIPIRATVVPVSGFRGQDRDNHSLLLMLHHIATDEWSDRPLLDDLATAYTARLEGRAPGWAPLPVQYGDHTLWQAELLGDPADPGSLAARRLDWWEATLAGAPDELELPADRPRPPRPTHAGGLVEHPLPDDVRTGLHALGRTHGASPFLVLHAAVVALLTRLGAGTDLPLGAPVTGRADERLEDLVGFFVDTVVLRTDTSGDPTPAELVARVRDADLAAFAHADVPHQAVVERVNPPREPGRNPLFQVMVAHHARTADTLPALPGVTVTEEPVEARTAKFDLVFSFAETTGDDAGLALHLEYSAERFDRATAASIAERFAAVAAAFATEPEVPLGRIDVLGPAGRAALAESAGDRDGGGAFAGPLSDVVSRHATADPDAIAVTDADGDLSYAELDGRAAAVAAHLAASGIGRRDVVAVAVGRDAGLAATVLGLWRLGAVWLPVDPAHPAERLTHLLTDSGAVALVATDAVAGRIPAVPGLPRLAPDGAPGESVPEPVALGPDDPAYLIYTSGSTGRPKGVLVPHDGIGVLTATAAGRFGLDAGSRVLQFASPGFDVVVFELAMALGSGGRLVVAPEEVRTAGPELPAFLARHGVTHAAIPPALLGALPAGTELPSGMHVLVGTEAVPADLVQRWAGRVALVVCYGLTEASVNSTLWRAEPLPDGRVPIGSPDPGTVVQILDERLAPVPDGVAGEMYVGGRGLALGYPGRAATTAERFVADPAGPPGARLYRTGDRVRRRDGLLEFLGRTDDQLKIRGHRVEPGEVAAVVSAHPAVRQAVVAARGDLLVAYVVPEPGGAPEPAGLRAHAAERLPAALVPGAVVVLDGPLPLTPNGKIDHRALDRLPLPGTGSGGPVTAAQRELAGLVGEVLGAADVGPDDDFFALGCHSMAAMRLIGRVRARFGADLSVRDVFDAPTVAALADLLARRPTDRPELVAGPPADPRGEPLAPAQVWRWARHRVDPRPDHALVLRPAEPYDTAALAAAVDDVVARHEPLRSVFTGPGPSADTSSAEGLRLVRDHGPGLVESTRPAAELAREPFDLTVEPPFRALLAAGGELVLVLHYLGVDEWSVVPLLRDLAAAYAARRQGRTPEFTPLPVTATDHARWARALAGVADDPGSAGPDTAESPGTAGSPGSAGGSGTADDPATADGSGSAGGSATAGESGTAGGSGTADGSGSAGGSGTAGGSGPEPDGRHARAVAYWQAALTGVPAPVDPPAPGTVPVAAETVVTELDPALRAEVEALARRERAGLFTVVQSALAVVLARRGAAVPVPTASFVAGRTEPALTDLVGSVADVAILPVRPGPRGVDAELLRTTRADDLAGYDHVSIGLAAVARAVWDADPARVRPTVLLVPHEDTGLADEQRVLGTLDALDTGGATADLTVSVAEPEGDGSIVLELTHRLDAWTGDEARALAGELVEELRAAVRR
ncbi:amino acid adenylation domain-containing protein [Pseudonocardia ammonioxydans]|uniref:Amino acid adenylation domain-containing protein n=1 Tax=Pseudonocardia ammonioxydans TaxID=260086 RepID=A0A1I4T5N5_PSUAM|nr:non-ribosomal peptide synthetase [Pseudonocardia ammonioxydans]SFM71927.1 amino acid adenylation domain-containing protein [Pseudonocardia ammonioxydans]